MSEVLEVRGGVPLKGKVVAGGAKNAALPMLLASLLTADEMHFSNVPALEDIGITLQLLEHFGATCAYRGSSLTVSVPTLRATEASYSLVRAMRASFWVLAPLLARGRAARVNLPGGDIIGARPVDLHLAALTDMGADIVVKHGVVFASAPQGLRPAHITLRFPSVGATHQVLMAAALTPGVTVLEGAAREPEVVALASMLSTMGAQVEGAGTTQIEIRGVEQLCGGNFSIIGDRIESGTFLAAAVATRGEVTVEGVDPTHLRGALELFSDLGAEVAVAPNSVKVAAHGNLRPIRCATGPFPAFATDLQAPLVAALATIDGHSEIEELVFEGRFGHVAELGRLGAHIGVEGRTILIEGGAPLSGAPVEARDIRAGAALVVAGLAADGATLVDEALHIRRGYERLDEKLRGLGAQVWYRAGELHELSGVGC